MDSVVFRTHFLQFPVPTFTWISKWRAKSSIIPFHVSIQIFKSAFGITLWFTFYGAATCFFISNLRVLALEIESIAATPDTVLFPKLATMVITFLIVVNFETFYIFVFLIPLLSFFYFLFRSVFSLLFLSISLSSPFSILSLYSSHSFSLLLLLYISVPLCFSLFHPSSPCKVWKIYTPARNR